MLKLTAIGNLGKDAVLRKIEGGNDTAISFNLAVNKRYKDSKGVQVESTTWVDCTLWRRADQSTEIAQYLKAGGKVYVEGEPTVRYYVNNQGEPVAQQVLKVSLVELLSAKKEEPAAEKPKPGELPASAFTGQSTDQSSNLNEPGKGGLPASEFDNEPPASTGVDFKKRKANRTPAEVAQDNDLPF